MLQKLRPKELDPILEFVEMRSFKIIQHEIFSHFLIIKRD